MKSWTFFTFWLLILLLYSEYIIISSRQVAAHTCRRCRRTAERHSLHRCTRPRLLQPLQNDTISRFQPVTHQPAVTNRPDHLDGARFHLLLGANGHDHGVTFLSTGHTALRDQDGVLLDPLLQNCADKHPRQQGLFRVGEDRPQGNGAGALVHRHFRKFQRSRQRIGAAVLQQQLDPRLCPPAVFQQAAGKILLQLQQLGAGLGHVNINRIQLLDRGKGSRLAGGHQRPFGYG